MKIRLLVIQGSMNAAVNIHLLEKIVNYDKHRSTKIGAAQEVEPGAFADVFLKSLLDSLDFCFAITFNGIGLRSDAAEGNDGFILTVFGEEPARRARDEERKEDND